MKLYLYVDGDSVLHRLDPRPKLLSVIAVILLAVSAEHPALPAALQALALLGIAVAGAWSSLRRVRALLVVITGFSVLVWTLLSRGATPLVGFVALESVLFGLSTGLKLSATITASVVWLATTRNEEIAAGLIRMGVPYRMAFAFSAALRMVPTFVGAGATIIEAQRARGLDVERGGPVRRMRNYLPMMVPVFAAALRSAHQMAMALEAKGFGAQPKRKYLLQLRMHGADWLAVGLAAAAAAASVWIAAGGYGRLPGLYR
ncbi:MAG: energy-coupling factor transporter transmembrane component T [Armatimonadota bacterium]|nr:energy-coupling factor transporter transmembrane component T [Armatimonadota bacterium]